MRARIIFRGLTLFTFEKTTEGAAADANLGTLTALLISDPKHDPMPLHRHKPYWGLIGRNRGQPTGDGRTEKNLAIPREMRIELQGHGVGRGVTADGSFLDYVPRLGELHEGPTASPREDLVRRKIIIPSGRIRTREFISWDWRGNTPARVAYMGTSFQGFGANEVIVDIGDDSDVDKHDENKFLALTGQGMDEKLWPRAKGAALVDDIDPNTVELLITNLTVRRRRPVFWGLHFQLLFHAAGFAPLSYRGGPQYTAFERFAAEYDPLEWRFDSSMMDIDQPFPFVMDPQSETLPKISRAAEPYILKGPPPAPPGRSADEGISADDHRGHGGHGNITAPGMDPVNTDICPFGRT
jgi:hypothetical protein